MLSRVGGPVIRNDFLLPWEATKVSPVDVGVEMSIRFVWEFRGDAIVVSFGGAEVFFLVSKKAFAFACVAALAFATSADFKSVAACSSFKRCTRNLALLDANSVDLFLPGFVLLGFVILDGLGICRCRCS